MIMELKKNEPCPYCGRYDNRGLSIDAIIVKENKLLLIERGTEPFKGSWAIVGGYIDWGERTEEVVKREVKEEIGVSVKKMRLLGVYSVPSRHPKQVITVVYVIDEFTGTSRESEEAVKIKWFSFSELPRIMAFDHRKIVNDALKFLHK